MADPRRIDFASPIEPSGASWLVNCFLELGIRVNHRPAELKLWRADDPTASVWIDADGQSTLSPRAEILGKWMPSLVHKRSFRFREDIVVDYRQDLPLRAEPGQTTILFVRDPRDALHSMFKRRQTEMSFAEFCRFPNPLTLLSAPDHWRLHTECWSTRAERRIYRFEEYKTDACSLLRRILGDLGIAINERALHSAIAASDIAQAKAAEAIYRERNPGDTEIANRAGRVGEAQSAAVNAGAIEMIERRAGPAMRRFGYLDAGTQDGLDPMPVQIAFLNIFEKIALSPSLRNCAGTPPDDPELAQRLSLLAGLTPQTLANAKLSPAACQQLITSMLEFDAALGSHMSSHLEAVLASVEDGKPAHLQTLNALLLKKRAARAARRNRD